MNEFKKENSKFRVQSSKPEAEEAESFGGEDLPVIDGEVSEGGNLSPHGESRKLKTEDRKPNAASRAAFVQYIYLPLIFLFVALLGGLRFDAADSSFLFLKPALVCLIYASVLIFLFFRASLLELDGWFDERFSAAKTCANAAVLIALFAATTQVFNSLLPERGAPFYVVAFCFFWTLWNNLFSEFDARRLIKSLAGMFALAFFVKYLILANLAAPPSDSFWQRITENPTKETLTYFLDLPRFAAATGYVQFFAVGFYLLGLFSMRRETR